MNSEQANSYDVIVIGGGLSGLMAGVTAARRGRRVLLLESHASVGGLAAGFTRKGYYFDAGMSRCMSYIRGPLKAAGITGFELKPHRTIMNVAGCWVDYSSVENYFAGLAEIFPEEKAGLLALYQREVKPAQANLAAFFAEIDGKDLSQKVFYWLRLVRALWSMSRSKSMGASERDVFTRYLDRNGRAYAFLVEKEDEVDYRGEMTFVTKVGKWLSQTLNIYPSIGYQGIADAMAGAITAHHGEVRTCAPVKKILIERGRAIGVEVEKHGVSEQIFAPKIICGIDLRKAFHRLIGDANLDADLIVRLEKSKLSRAIPILYLGVNLPPEVVRARFQGRDEVWYTPRLDPEPGTPGFFRDHSLLVHSSCFHNPEHAPAGKTNLQVYLSCPPDDWMDNWGIQDGARTGRYREIKTMAIQDVLGALESIIPELAERSLIEVCELGTPFTLERYTANSGGSCMGFRLDADFINSKKFGQYFDHLTNITNLYFAGQQTGYPGGLLNALGAGKHAGQLV